MDKAYAANHYSDIEKGVLRKTKEQDSGKHISTNPKVQVKQIQIK